MGHSKKMIGLFNLLDFVVAHCKDPDLDLIAVGAGADSAVVMGDGSVLLTVGSELASWQKFIIEEVK